MLIIVKLDVCWYKIVDFISFLNFEWHSQNKLAILAFLSCEEIMKNSNDDYFHTGSKGSLHLCQKILSNLNFWQESHLKVTTHYCYILSFLISVCILVE